MRLLLHFITRNNWKRFTPTLIVPHQGGGNFRKDRFTVPDQVEDRLHGNDILGCGDDILGIGNDNLGIPQRKIVMHT